MGMHFTELAHTCICPQPASFGFCSCSIFVGHVFADRLILKCIWLWVSLRVFYTLLIWQMIRNNLCGSDGEVKM